MFWPSAGSVALALSDSGGAGALKGDLLAVAAAVFVAAYTLIGQVQRGHQSTTVYTFLTYASCLAALLCMDLFTGTPILGWGLREAAVGLLLAVFCTLLGHSLFSWSLKWLSSAYVSAAKLCEPVFASILGFFLFREAIRPLQALGALTYWPAYFSTPARRLPMPPPEKRRAAGLQPGGPYLFLFRPRPE